jgi:Flp pilus assembly protein TadG
MASGIKTRTKALAGDTRGSVFVEAALVLPLLVIILASIAEWGLMFYQYHLLSNANAAAVRQLTVNRGFPSPYTAVTTEFTNWAANLNPSDYTLTVEIQNASNTFEVCNSDANCTTKLDAAQGKAARVAVNFSCVMSFTPNLASPCPIQISKTGLVE